MLLIFYFYIIIFLLIFSSFFSFCINFLFSSFIGTKGVKIITITNSLILFILSFYILIKIVLTGNFFFLTCCYWLNIGFLKVYWSFSIDFLGAVMMFTVSLVSLLVIIFSFEYMKTDPFFSRFISILSVFTFFMILFVSSDNFIQFFLGWEGIGLCSYFLINFWFSRIQAVKAAFKALIINRVGDVSLLSAIALVFFLTGSVDFSVLTLLIPFLQLDYILLFMKFKINLLYLISILLTISVLSKSAQIGLHTWLPDAMEGPTPVSALIHAATMVTAGVYLIIRLSFIFEFVPKVLSFMVFIGAFTAFFSATIALVQMDIKKLIAYSTCSQLGYMVYACGLSLYNLSLFHLFNHAFFKALLFLSAGSIIHSLNNEQDFRKMGGLLKILPNTYISLLIGSLSLCGFPFLSGFFSKDLIIELSILNFELEKIFCFWLIYICAYLTVLYSIKLIFLVFYSTLNYNKSKINSIMDGGILIFFSLFILLIFSIFSGFLFKELIIGCGSFFYSSSILELPKSISFFEMESIYEFYGYYNFSFFYLILVKFLPIYVSFFGIFIYYIYFLYGYKIIFLNIFFKYSKFIFFFSNKWYIDFIYNNFIVKPFLVFIFNIFFNYFDKGLLEFFGPSSIIKFSFKFSKISNKVQFNYFQNFIYLILFFILVLYFIIILF